MFERIYQWIIKELETTEKYTASKEWEWYGSQKWGIQGRIDECLSLYKSLHNLEYELRTGKKVPTAKPTEKYKRFDKVRDVINERKREYQQYTEEEPFIEMPYEYRALYYGKIDLLNYFLDMIDQQEALKLYKEARDQKEIYRQKAQQKSTHSFQAVKNRHPCIVKRRKGKQNKKAKRKLNQKKKTT